MREKIAVSSRVSRIFRTRKRVAIVRRVIIRHERRRFIHVRVLWGNIEVRILQANAAAYDPAHRILQDACFLGSQINRFVRHELQ